MPGYPALNGLYQVQETIGTGGFAKVKLGQHILTGEKVAIKIMDKNFLGDDEISHVRVEIEAMKSLTHQNICKLYEVIETKDKFFMILEYCSGGELFDYIVENDHLPEIETQAFFRQIISALAHVHGRGYVHRDLKPENFLFDDEQNLKLIDFGLCTRPQGGLQSVLNASCGSPAYAAPELIEGKQYLGSEADLWSLGVLLYTMLCGCLPFEDENTMYLYEKIQAGKYDVPDWLSNESANVLHRLLQVDPKCRATIEDLMEDPWVTEDCIHPIEWRSQETHDNLDDECLTLLSSFHEKTKDEMRQLITEWNYDHITSTYLLLLNRKRKRKPVALKGFYPTSRRPSQEKRGSHLSNGFAASSCEGLAAVSKKAAEISLTDKDDFVYDGLCLSPPTADQIMDEVFAKAGSVESKDYVQMETVNGELDLHRRSERFGDAYAELGSHFEAEAALSEGYFTTNSEEPYYRVLLDGGVNGNYGSCIQFDRMEQYNDLNMMDCRSPPDQPTFWPALGKEEAENQPIGVEQPEKNEFHVEAIVQNGPKGWECKRSRSAAPVRLYRSRCLNRCHNGRNFRASSSSLSRGGWRKTKDWNRRASLPPKIAHKRTCCECLGDEGSHKLPLWSSLEFRQNPDVHLNGVEAQCTLGNERNKCFKVCCWEKPAGVPKLCHRVDSQKIETGQRPIHHVASFCPLKADRAKFQKMPVGRLSSQRMRNYSGQQQRKTLQDPKNHWNSTITPSRSFDSQLNNLSLDTLWQLQVNNDQASSSVDTKLNRLHLNWDTPEAKSKKLLIGNKEHSNDRSHCVMTRREKAQQAEPRKLRDARNIILTNYVCPSAVLNRLKAALEEKNVPYQETGNYVLHSVITNETNKVQVTFDLEVVQVRESSAIGIQRKRLKGDLCHYKRLCESIFTAAHL